MSLLSNKRLLNVEVIVYKYDPDSDPEEFMFLSELQSLQLFLLEEDLSVHSV